MLFAITTAGVNAEVIDGEELADPTRPLQFSSQSGNEDDEPAVQNFFRRIIPDTFSLSFIRAGGNTPMAIINQRQLTVGDIIDDAEVIAIDRDGVTLRTSDEEKRISLYGISVKSNVVGQ